MSTITLSSIPDLTASVSVPRLAAVEYPLGYLLGRPGDAAGQTAVLRAALTAAEQMTTPGSEIHLPFEWPAEGQKLRAKPPQTPPIVRHLLRHPWHIRNFFAREIPGRKH
ncbi:MAG: hypothetical protein R3293_21570 [Candidatus Promineifilaceae bacterium]|nr:hypothetical protein [Candidatus Promineifilaceae bacterium]